MRSILFFLLFIISSFAYGQETKPTYFEAAGDGFVRFFYDRNYYLVDKNCEFKSIERLAAFDPKLSQFTGAFTDFGNDGKVLLEGSYKAGKKDGLFKAYHPNLQIKWQVTFVEGASVGNWTFYFPDGKPMMIINFQGEMAKLTDLWNNRGRKLVDNGNGRYDFKIPFVEFNPYGYPFVRLRGSLKDGLPTGYWQVFFEDGKHSVLAAEEIYEKNGVFRSGQDLFTEEDYRQPRFPIGPVEQFSRAELMISKPCTFDDFSDFSLYLANTVNGYFQSVIFQLQETREIEYTIQVNKQGIPKNLEIKTKISPEFDRLFEQAAKSIFSYLPSYKDGEYVDDELTVKLQIQQLPNNGVSFHSVQIIRKAETP